MLCLEDMNNRRQVFVEIRSREIRVRPVKFIIGRLGLGLRDLL